MTKREIERKDARLAKWEKSLRQKRKDLHNDIARFLVEVRIFIDELETQKGRITAHAKQSAPPETK